MSVGARVEGWCSSGCTTTWPAEHLDLSPIAYIALLPTTPHRLDTIITQRFIGLVALSLSSPSVSDVGSAVQCGHPEESLKSRSDSV